jgi:proteic killer suppression protein
MILSFGEKETEELWTCEKSKRYGNIARVALRKLLQLHAAEKLGDVAVPPGISLKRSLESAKGNIQSVLTINGESVSFGRQTVRRK